MDSDGRVTTITVYHCPSPTNYSEVFIMSLDSDTAGSRILNWSLTIGGGICLVIGVLVLVKSQQPPIPRSSIFLISVFVLNMGIGNLLEHNYPEWASRFKFIAKVFAGFAIFSISWGLSHS
jgi:hypothetical protein